MSNWKFRYIKRFFSVKPITTFEIINIHDEEFRPSKIKMCIPTVKMLDSGIRIKQLTIGEFVIAHRKDTKSAKF